MSRLPRLPAALLAAAFAPAERTEVVADLAVEHATRRAAHGRLAASLWLWRQAVSSLPALARRGWWRGWTGFEPRAERLQPGGVPLESLAIDTRFALRRLRRRPGYTALAALTLALGVAGTTAVCGIARALLLAPLPVAEESGIVLFWGPGSWSDVRFLALRDGLAADLPALAAYRPQDATLHAGDAPAERVAGVAATRELFDVLGVGPAFGPGFAASEDGRGAEASVVLGHALWRRLGGEVGIVGRAVELSGVSRTVVGVMPEGFWFPDPGVEVWLSEPLDPDNDDGNLTLVGRLRAGRTVAAADDVARRARALLAARFPARDDAAAGVDAAEGHFLALREHLVGDARPALLALLAAVALLQLVACANVAALLLGQLESRAGELALRNALGAGRRRLLQQLAVECLVLGVLAGAVGGGAAIAGFGVLVRALPLGPLAAAARPDWALFALAMGSALAASTAVAAVGGLAATAPARRARLARGRVAAVAGRGGRLEQALVVAQVALVLTLAGTAALLVRSVDERRSIDPGVDLERVAVIDVQLPSALANDRVPALVGELVAALAAVPGVEAAGATQRLPLRGEGDHWPMHVEGRDSGGEVSARDPASLAAAAALLAAAGVGAAAVPAIRASRLDPAKVLREP
jgi:putative ABC transport system permease protein